jgi:transcriptional regulator with XRE-family HTH domain
MVMLSTPLRSSAGRPQKEVPEGNTFGTWLRQARLSRGLTGEQLAARVGEKMTQGRISGYERGSKNPEKETVEALADALAGPDALPEDRQRLRNEALAAFADIDAPEITSEPFTEDTLEVAHMYQGIADPRFRAKFKEMLKTAVEIFDEEPADAGPSRNGTD